MTEDLIELQQRLIIGYQAQLPLYDRALQIIALAAAESASSPFRVQDLNAVLRDIAALDATLAQDKAAWRASGRKPSPRLRDMLEAVTERIRKLSGHIDRRVAELQERKQALLPEVDVCIQQRRMLSAYGKSR